MRTVPPLGSRPAASPPRPGLLAVVATTPGYRPALDGLRALAVAVVVVFHLAPAALPGGFVGVDVFFVLSGYLITGLLLRELDRDGRVDLAAFAVRRVRRILPAALTVIAVTAAATVALANAMDRALVAGDVLPAAFAFTNWHELGTATDYFAPTRELTPFSHFWSLAVEEQFYLVWPLATAALWWATRRLGPRARSLGTVVVAVAAVGGIAWWVDTGRHDPVAAYYATWFRAAQLAAGAALAWLEPRRLATSRRAGRAGAALAAGGLVLVALVVVGVRTGDPYPGAWGPLVTLGTVAAVAGLEVAPSGWAGTVLARRPVVAVGLLSYSLYLWHIPVAELAPLLADRVGVAPLAGIPGMLGLTAALALASFRLVETPVRHSGRSQTARRAPVILGALAGVALVGVGARVVLERPAEVDLADVTAEELVAAAHDRPDTYATGCHGGQESDWTGRACVRRPAGEEPVVALVGDSHAANWDSALAEVAEAEDVGYEYATYSACPPVDVAYDEGSQAPGCRRFRSTVLPELADLGQEDTVVLAFSWTPFAEELSRTRDPGARSAMVEELARALGATAGALDDHGAEIVVLGPIPVLADSAPGCLADAEEAEECRTPVGGSSPEEVLAGEVLDPLLASHVVDAVVPVEDIVCPGDACDALEEGVVTYRDREHLTRAYSRSLASELGAALEAAGVEMD